MGAPIDITGQRFTFLQVLRLTEQRASGGARLWLVRCDCGKEFMASASGLRSEHVTKCRSCATRMCRPALKHGHAVKGHISPEYKAWTEMLDRCLNQNNHAFNSYGGRGIKIHPPWTTRGTGFVLFLAEIGPRPSKKHMLDRIDNEGSYVPGNIRWATRGESNRNKRSNIRIRINDQMMTVAEWAREKGLPEYLIYRRLKDGWPSEIAVCAPLGHQHKRSSG